MALPEGVAKTALLDRSGRLVASGTDYETVAAAQTDHQLGTTGAAGDFIARLVIVPASTSPGAVMIQDGAEGADITIFAGGSSSIPHIAPISVELGMVAQEGWLISTGANVSVIAVGDFT
jgi:hypothetical protein